MDMDNDTVRKKILNKKVYDDPPSPDLLKLLGELVEYYDRIHGFMAGHVAEASKILKDMVENAELRIASFTANIVASGLRGLLALAIKRGIFNIIVTTTGTIDHDVAKALSTGYFKGKFDYDDLFLEEHGIFRLGNILIPKENYGSVIEGLVRKIFEKSREKYENAKLAPYELLWEVGRELPDENSILRAAWSKRIPVIVPGFYDGSFGTNVYWASRLYNVDIDLRKDQELMETMFFKDNLTSGAIIIGGGISKHHVIWWSQFHGGLKYAVYITTATEYDGSLSGARTREALSWGKLKKDAKHVVVYSDATIVLPIILSSVL